MKRTLFSSSRSRLLAGVLGVVLAIAPAPLLAAETDPPPTVPGLRPLAAPVDAPALAPPPPPPAAPPPLAAPTEAPPKTHVVSYVTGAQAVVAAGTGIAFGVLALNAKSDFQNHPTVSGADAGNNYAAYCDGSLGAAVVLAATSIVFFFVERDAQSGASRAQQAQGSKKSLVSFTAAPTLSPHGAGAGATLRF